MISKILSILVPPLFANVPLHFSWSGNGTDLFYPRRMHNADLLLN